MAPLIVAVNICFLTKLFWCIVETFLPPAVYVDIICNTCHPHYNQREMYTMQGPTGGRY
jgi:hypothetical protein